MTTGGPLNFPNHRGSVWDPTHFPSADPPVVPCVPSLSPRVGGASDSSAVTGVVFLELNSALSNSSCCLEGSSDVGHGRGSELPVPPRAAAT